MENNLKIDSLIKFFIKKNNLENGLENVKIKDLWQQKQILCYELARDFFQE